MNTFLRHIPNDSAAWLSLLCRCILAVVFLAAAIPKFFNPSEFAQTISMYGLVPGGLLFEVAVMLIAAELITAAGLLMNRGWAVVSAAVMLLIFIAVLGYGIYLGLDIDCGCFGPEDPGHDALNSLRTSFIRDLFLLIPVGYLLITQKFIQIKQKQLSGEIL